MKFGKRGKTPGTHLQHRCATEISLLKTQSFSTLAPSQHAFRQKLPGVLPLLLKFIGLGHGDNVEGVYAGLTDAQLIALSGHETTAALLRYAQETLARRIEGAKERRELRTKKGGLSE